MRDGAIFSKQMGRGKTHSQWKILLNSRTFPLGNRVETIVEMHERRLFKTMDKPTAMQNLAREQNKSAPE